MKRRSWRLIEPRGERHFLSSGYKRPPISTIVPHRAARRPDAWTWALSNHRFMKGVITTVA